MAAVLLVCRLLGAWLQVTKRQILYLLHYFSLLQIRWDTMQYLWYNFMGAFKDWRPWCLNVKWPALFIKFLFTAFRRVVLECFNLTVIYFFTSWLNFNHGDKTRRGDSSCLGEKWKWDGFVSTIWRKNNFVLETMKCDKVCSLECWKLGYNSSEPDVVLVV